MERIAGLKTKSIGILSIATNDYLKYWREMAKSIDISTQGKSEVVLHLFTDQPKIAESFASTLGKCKVKIYEIPSLGWPDATLLRYRIFNQHLEKLTEDILMYLDADMFVNIDLPEEIESMYDSKNISLVSHPGFWREKGLTRRILLYVQHPKLAISDLRLRISLGGLGSWESNVESKAFVPRSKRKDYVCGGTWLGPNQLIKKLIAELTIQVEEDRSNDVIAVWHDESHLNAWASKNIYYKLSPRYCHDATYIQLRNVSPGITAVNKAII